MTFKQITKERKHKLIDINLCVSLIIVFDTGIGKCDYGRISDKFKPRSPKQINVYQFLSKHTPFKFCRSLSKKRWR